MDFNAKTWTDHFAYTPNVHATIIVWWLRVFRGASKEHGHVSFFLFSKTSSETPSIRYPNENRTRQPNVTPLALTPIRVPSRVRVHQGSRIPVRNRARGKHRVTSMIIIRGFSGTSCRPERPDDKHTLNLCSGANAVAVARYRTRFVALKSVGSNPRNFLPDKRRLSRRTTSERTNKDNEYSNKLRGASADISCPNGRTVHAERTTRGTRVDKSDSVCDVRDRLCKNYCCETDENDRNDRTFFDKRKALYAKKITG